MSVPTWPCLVGGDVRPVDGVRDVRSPWDGRVAARVAWAGAAEMEAAVVAAADAMRAPLAPVERERVLQRAGALVEAHAEELAAIVTAESGKPIKAARAEVARTAATLRIAAGEASRLHGEQVPLGRTDLGSGPLALTVRKPIGVVAAIAPFNFPLNLVAHKVAPALAAGCAVVVKPADKVPGPAVRLAQLLAEAGLPAGWISVVVGEPQELADVLLRSPQVRLVSFTGSAAVGWELARRAGTKKVALELGNITPAIVAGDADLARAARELAAGAFAGSGQACVSVQRVYVQRAAYDAFVTLFADAARALQAGDPADEATDVGPLITREATERLVGWIAQASERGARVLAGGNVEDGVLEPTVLADVPVDAALACEEAFGPVVSVWPYDELAEAIEAANATEHGLQAGIFTRDLATAMHAASALDFAGVIVNASPSWRADEMPYGGLKASGNTREGPAHAVREMTEECLLVLHA